jgi:hypothetical protein
MSVHGAAMGSHASTRPGTAGVTRDVHGMRMGSRGAGAGSKRRPESAASSAAAWFRLTTPRGMDSRPATSNWGAPQVGA